jgi:hypothetical protein
MLYPVRLNWVSPVRAMVATIINLASHSELLGSKQERRWRRFLGRLVKRDLWRFNGLLLWLVRRPYLRFWPLPFPQCSNQAEYESNQRQSGAVRHRAAITPDIFKELLWLRQRMGNVLCWKFHSVIWEIILAAKASKTAYRRAVSASVQANSHLSLNELLGPRQGMPKTKDKLILVAQALDIPSWGTVAELSTRCREAMGRTQAQTRARPTPEAGDGITQSTGSSSSAANSAELATIAQLRQELEEMKRATMMRMPPNLDIAELTSIPEDLGMDLDDGWSHQGEPPFNDFR